MKVCLMNSALSVGILYSIGWKDKNNLLVSGPELRELLKWPRPLPLEDERIRLLHEVKLTFPLAFPHAILLIDGKISSLKSLNFMV